MDAICKHRRSVNINASSQNGPETEVSQDCRFLPVTCNSTYLYTTIHYPKPDNQFWPNFSVNREANDSNWKRVNKTSSELVEPRDKFMFADNRCLTERAIKLGGGHSQHERGYLSGADARHGAIRWVS